MLIAWYVPYPDRVDPWPSATLVSSEEEAQALPGFIKTTEPHETLGAEPWRKRMKGGRITLLLCQACGEPAVMKVIDNPQGGGTVAYPFCRHCLLGPDMMVAWEDYKKQTEAASRALFGLSEDMARSLLEADDTIPQAVKGRAMALMFPGEEASDGTA